MQPILQRIRDTGLSGIPSFDGKRQTEAEIFNNLQGKLEGYDCPKCKNKGIIYAMQGEELISHECECMKTRRSIDRFKRSGLETAIKSKTLLNFTHSEDFQNAMLNKAVNFVKSGGRCFFIGGQIGCGKTHICTGIAGALLKRGKAVRYIQWRDDIPKLKAAVTTQDYAAELEKIKKVDVLYIDDLFKTKDEATPTAADINIAFEVINYRYNNPELITIISCQQMFAELLTVDEATASRIAEMCGEYSLSIARDIKRNYRLKGMIDAI